jgi:hypothetical protein
MTEPYWADPRYRAMNPREEGLFAPSIYGQSYRVPGGVASATRTSIGHGDAMSQAGAQRSDNAGALQSLMDPLLSQFTHGPGFPETERGPTIQAMQEILARPAWAPEERAYYMNILRQMGLMAPEPSVNLEDAMFMPPGMR